MLFVITGCLGFGFIILFDCLSMRKKDKLKTYAWILGCGLITYSTVMLCLTPDKFGFPLWVMISGGVMTLFFSFIIIYVLFINLPFRRTYHKTQDKPVLIRRGGYALTRHPGVLVLAFLLFALLLLSGAKLMLTATLIFVIVDIIIVVIEDVYFFPRFFPDYNQYRKETPMLIPNKKSIRAFFQSRNRV